MKLCKLPWDSLYHIRRVPGISMAFRDIVPKRTGELGGQPGAPWGIREAFQAAGLPLSSHVDETSKIVPSPFSSSYFFSMFVRGEWFLLKYLVLLNLVINLMLQKDVLSTSVLHRIGAVHHLTLRSVQRCSTYLDFIRTTLYLRMFCSSCSSVPLASNPQRLCLFLLCGRMVLDAHTAH